MKKASSTASIIFIVTIVIITQITSRLYTHLFPESNFTLKLLLGFIIPGVIVAVIYTLIAQRVLDRKKQ